MKSKTSSYFRLGQAALLASCALALTSLPSHATVLSKGVNLGAAGPNQAGRNWAVFSLGGMEDDNKLTGMSDVIGDVGIACGDLSLSGNAKITGTAYIKTGGQYKKSGNASITGNGGVPIQNPARDAILSAGVNDVTSAYNAAKLLGASVGYPTTINANNSFSLSTMGDAVLKLTDFKLSSGAVLTLNGPSTGSFIVNVSNNFELTGGSKVVLAGGLTWDNVIFNVLNKDAKLTGSSQFNGIIMAKNGTVEINGPSKVLGEVIADRVKISGGGNVTRPPLVSPF